MRAGFFVGLVGVAESLDDGDLGNEGIEFCRFMLGTLRCTCLLLLCLRKES